MSFLYQGLVSAARHPATVPAILRESPGWRAGWPTWKEQLVPIDLNRPTQILLTQFRQKLGALDAQCAVAV